MRLIALALFDVLALLWELLTWGPRALARRKPFFVALELSGDLPWRRERHPRWTLRARRRPRLAAGSVREICRAFEEVAADRRARGVVVRVEGFTGSGAKLEALRRAALALRAAKKEVVFYGRAVGLREYGLMAAGTRVHLAPGGRLHLTGYSAELLALAEVLARLGIRAHFLRRGEHKTAPELFTQREVSRAHREAVQGILEELLDSSVRAIAEGRRLAQEDVRARIDQGPYTSARALASGLIDSVGDGEELQALLAGPGEKKARLWPLPSYRGPARLVRRGALEPLRPMRGIAVVELEGAIKLGRGLRLPAIRAAGADGLVEAMARARDDARVKAIVLAIDSGGGSSLASELIRRAVRRADQVKPVVAFFDRVAASGGYLAAVGARAIVCAPGAVTGSIGVFAGKFEIASLLDRAGAGRALLRAGRRAAAESPFEPWTEEERAVLDAEVEEVYQEFLEAVAQGRKRPKNDILPLAEGRIFSGRRAREAGLVDELGDFEDALRMAADLAGLRGPPRVLRLPGPPSPLGSLARLLSDGELSALLPLESERTFAAAEVLWRVRPRL